MSTLTVTKSERIGGISVSFRDQPIQEDLANVRRIAESSGFFQAGEIEVAAELVQARLTQGAASGYHFLFADAAAPVGQTIGYTCFGPIPCTRDSFDLYWIAVSEPWRGIGLGKHLLAESERTMRRMGGRRIYVETSSRSQYEPTRSFYTRNGYRQEALIRDFYAPGDGKLIFVKQLR